VKLQNRARGDTNGGNIWTLSRSGTRKQTDGTQNHSEGMAHGLGLSPSEKQKQRNNSKFAQGCGQRETCSEWRIVYRHLGTAAKSVPKTCAQTYDAMKTNGLILCCPTIWKDNYTHGRKGKMAARSAKSAEDGSKLSLSRRRMSLPLAAIADHIEFCHSEVAMFGGILVHAMLFHFILDLLLASCMSALRTLPVHGYGMTL